MRPSLKRLRPHRQKRMIGRKTLQTFISLLPKIYNWRTNVLETTITTGQQIKQIGTNVVAKAPKNSKSSDINSTLLTLIRRTKNSSNSRTFVSSFPQAFETVFSSRTVGFGIGTFLTLGTALAEDRRSRRSAPPERDNTMSKLNQLEPFGDVAPIVNLPGEVDVSQLMDNIVKLHSTKGKQEQETMQEVQQLLKEGKSLSALKKVQKLIDENPTNPLYHIVLADVYKFRKDGNRVIEEYREALRLDPNLALVHFWLAETMIPFLRAKEAIEHLDRVLELQKTGGLRTLAMLLKAFAFAHIGKGHDALSLCVEVAKANPPLRDKENIRLLYRIQMEILNSDNRHQDFLALLEFIRKQHPWMIDDLTYHGFKADAYCSLKDFPQAMKEYDIAIKGRKGDDISFIAKAACQEQAGMIPEAIATYQQAAKYTTEPEGFILRQASLLLRLRAYDKVLEVLKPLQRGEETDGKGGQILMLNVLDMVRLYSSQAERALRRQKAAKEQEKK